MKDIEHFGHYLINRVRKTNPRGVPPCIGCTTEEIENLMKAQGVSRLPRFYREYLEVMGKQGIMSINAGSDWSYERLLTIKQKWQASLKMNNFDFIIPEKSFIFFQHGGYDYRYFMTDHDNDDAPIYYWEEDDSEQGYRVYPKKTLREYLEAYVDLYNKPANY
ncbi:MAG: SMI1/KNR4 family protein [Anaerolineae bacterium]